VSRRLSILALALLVAYFFLHLGVVLSLAVDLPFWDEWEMLNPNGLSRHLDLGWLFRQHTDHRIVLTKLQIWILYHLNGWDLRTQQGINFFVFGGLIATLFKVCQKTAPTMPFWVLSPFLLFCLSPLPSESHAWAFESQFHFMLLFIFWTMHFLFSPTQNPKIQVLALSCLVLAMFSISGGITAALGGLSVYAVYSLLRGVRKNTLRQEFIRLSIVLLFFTAAGVSWLIGFQRPVNLPPKMLFHKAAFWDFFFNLISFGFGFEWQFWPLGFFCFLLVGLPFGLLFLRALRAKKDPIDSSWSYLSVTSCLLMILLTITIGRAAWGVGTSKTVRYAEFAVLLLPLTAAAWWNLLKTRIVLRNGILITLFLVAMIGLSDNWSFEPYRKVQRSQRQGVECVKAFYLSGGGADCTVTSNKNLTPFLIRAKELNLSFYRKIIGH